MHIGKYRVEMHKENSLPLHFCFLDFRKVKLRNFVHFPQHTSHPFSHPETFA